VVDEKYNEERGTKFVLTGKKRMGLYMVGFVVLPWCLMVGEAIHGE
jgi:hypothetical protein